MHRTTSIAPAPAFTPAFTPASSAAWAPRLLRARLPGQWMRREEAIMGCTVVVELWSEHGGAGEAALASVMAEMHRVDRATSALKPLSELSRIHREAPLGAVRLSEEMFQLLERARQLAALTRGAFDIVREVPARPVAAAVQRRVPGPPGAARTPADWRALELDAGALGLRLQPGLRLDVVGLARAHALDRCRALLQQRGVAHARLSAGSDLRVIGDRRGRPWSTGIGAGVAEGGELLALLPLGERALSSCSAPAQGVLRDASVVGGAGAAATPAALRCAAVLASDSVTAHAFARALFVLGAKAGLRLVDRQPGVDAMVIDGQGRLRRSRAWREAPARSALH